MMIASELWPPFSKSDIFAIKSLPHFEWHRIRSNDTFGFPSLPLRSHVKSRRYWLGNSTRHKNGDLTRTQAAAPVRSQTHKINFQHEPACRSLRLFLLIPSLRSVKFYDLNHGLKGPDDGRIERQFYAEEHNCAGYFIRSKFTKQPRDTPTDRCRSWAPRWTATYRRWLQSTLSHEAVRKAMQWVDSKATSREGSGLGFRGLLWWQEGRRRRRCCRWKSFWWSNPGRN